MYTKSTKAFTLLIMFLLLTSCNKQKAEAVKVAAEKFRYEAILGLEQMNYLFSKNISVVNQNAENEAESIVNDLNNIEDISEINAALLDFWSGEANIGLEVADSMNKEFDELKSQYYHFEALFTNIERGSFLNKNSVKKAEKYAIQLTLQLINFSKIIQENQFRNTAERVLLIERMRAAKSEENLELQKELLRNVAREFVELRMEENQTKDQAIRQCLKAAESGRVIAELIKDYDSLSVGDILISIKNSMNFAIQMNGGNEKVSDLVAKFGAIENTINEDPYWQAVLKKKIN